MTAVPVTLVPVITEPHEVDVVLLDPRTLSVHPRNLHVDLGDLTGLTASIAAQGVLEPLIVVPLPDGGHQLLAGHRRTAAAIAAGTPLVPCILRPDLIAADDAGLAEHVGAMLAENLHRQGLTPVEEARGVQMMLDLGVDVDGIAARTGLDRRRVATAAGAARLSPAVAAAVTGAGLTLDQVAVVADYANAPEVVGELVAAAGEGPGRFAHAVTRAEQERATAQRLAERQAELERAGRTVLLEYGDALRVHDLLQGGEVLDAEQHADCPGAAVVLQDSWNGDVHHVEVCTDPAGHGHVYRWARSWPGKGAAMSDEELERQRAERRQVIENNRAMTAANSTRRAWICELLARRKAPAGVLRFAVETLATDRSALADWFGGNGSQDVDDAAAELGLSRPSWRLSGEEDTLTSGARVPDARLPLQLLAHVAAALEGRITRDAWRWQDHRGRDAVRWFRFLVEEGYELSDIEQIIVDRHGTTA